MMNWNKINDNTYECITNHWHFFIETNPEGENILSYITHYKTLKNSKKTLLIEDDVKKCFYYAFDINLKSERERNN